MLTRLELFSWLVALEALDAEPERQQALRGGYDLAQRAVAEGLLPNDGEAHGQVARLLAELQADGWVAWDWVRLAGDPRPDQPPASMFGEQDLQRVQNIRITPEGYSAFAARQGLTRLHPREDRTADHAARAAHAGAREGEGEEPTYDLFISHASEDKDAVARPLAEELTRLGFDVWYDEDQIEVGNSLRSSIEAGLASSRYGVVVLSRAFFEKPWPQQELNGLFAREMADGQDVILPLWHEIDAGFLKTKAPMLLDRFALSTAVGVAAMAQRLARRLRRQQGEEQLQARLREDVAALPPPPAPPVTNAPPTRVEDEGEEGGAATAIRDATLAMLRADDLVGLGELLAVERHRFQREVTRVLQTAGDTLGSSAEPEALAPVGKELWTEVDRRLGSLLAVAQYRPDALADEIRSLAAFAARTVPTRSPYAAWQDGLRWPVWLVTVVLGSVATALERFQVIPLLWSRRVPGERSRPLPAMRLRGGAELGAALLRARPANAKMPELWYPAFAVWDSPMLRAHYPEVMQASESPDAVSGFLERAGDFLWICGALAGRDGIEMIRYWDAPQVHSRLRHRLLEDIDARARLAEALEQDPHTLVQTLDAWHLGERPEAAEP